MSLADETVSPVRVALPANTQLKATYIFLRNESLMKTPLVFGELQYTGKKLWRRKCSITARHFSVIFTSVWSGQNAIIRGSEFDRGPRDH